MIYTRLPAGGTYYPICMFPTNSESLIGISDAFSAFCLRVSVIFPTCSLYPQQKRAYSALHPIYTGPCPKALTECSPLDFRRSSINTGHPVLTEHICKSLLEHRVHSLSHASAYGSIRSLLIDKIDFQYMENVAHYSSHLVKTSTWHKAYKMFVRSSDRQTCLTPRHLRGERERKRERERETERDRDRDRQTQRERENMPY